MRQVTVADMMDARERRQALQTELLERNGLPLCCLTLNIPGPVKACPWIENVFDEGKRLLLASLGRYGMDVAEQKEMKAYTGCELLVSARGEAEKIKKIASALEDRNAFGRLLDIDVLVPGRGKLSRTESGLPPRRCMLCSNEAAVCARSRAHSWQEVFAWAESTADSYFRARWAERIASLACRALLYELLATPKPGLVDRLNNGAHRDMDCFTFAASASALIPFFQRCAEEGLDSRGDGPAMSILRQEGILAEDDMLRATGGVNTHKGAIFSLGLLCAAAGQDAREETFSASRLLGRVASFAGGEINRTLTDIQPRNARTAGERQYAQNGLRGARGEAADGFPTVAGTALPALQKELERGESLNDAAVHTLLAIMSVCEDSNVVKRSSPARAEAVRAQAKKASKRRGLSDAYQMDRQFIQENISPGGSADLLAAALFAYLWENQSDPPPPYPAPAPTDTAYSR